MEQCSNSSKQNSPQHSCFADLVPRPVNLRNAHKHMFSVLASVSDAVSSAPGSYISCRRCTCSVHRESVALRQSYWASVSSLMPLVLSCNCLSVLCISRPDSACRYCMRAPRTSDENNQYRVFLCLSFVYDSKKIPCTLPYLFQFYRADKRESL